MKASILEADDIPEASVLRLISVTKSLGLSRFSRPSAENFPPRDLGDVIWGYPLILVKQNVWNHAEKCENMAHRTYFLSLPKQEKRGSWHLQAKEI